MEQVAGSLPEKTKEYPYSLVTIILTWCGLVVVSSLYVTIPMVSVFAHEFHVSPSQASWVSSAFSFSYAIGFLFFGALSEKYGRKQMMLYGLFSLSLVSPILGLVQSLPGLIFLRAIQGLVAATFAPAVLTYIVEMYPAGKRVTTVGFVSTGFLMAGIIGQVFSSFVTLHFGWSSVFYALGAIYLLSALLFGKLVPDGENPRKQVDMWTSFRQMKDVFSSRSLLSCYLVTITLLLSFVGMYTALGQYVSQAPFSLSSNQIMLVRTVGIIGMFASPFAGRLTHKFGAPRVLQAGLLLASAGLSLMGISSTLPLLIGMSVVFVTGISLAVPTLITIIGSLAGAARGISVTMYTFLLFIGATFGPILAIKFMQSGNYTLTFEGFALILGIAIVASLLIKSK